MKSEIIKSNTVTQDTDLTPIEIALQIDEKGETTAKKLYEFLGLDLKNYSRWCIKNILDNEFAIENEDYKVFVIKEENPLGGRPSQDYKLSTSFAKKLAMGTHNEQGEAAKDYFIKVEDKLKEKQVTYLSLQNQMKEMINAAVTKAVSKAATKEINKVEEKCSEFYRPTHFTKYSISKYIKNRLGISKSNEEYELVKQRIFIIFQASKWEDIPIEVLSNSMHIIDESIDVIKKDRPYSQVSMFDYRQVPRARM